MNQQSPRRRHRAGLAAAGLAVGVASLLAPAAVATAAVTAPPAAGSAQVGAPVANTLDTKVTVKNEGSPKQIELLMGAGDESKVPTQISFLKTGYQASMQGWNHAWGGKDVVAVLVFDPARHDALTVSGENPAVGKPSLQINDEAATTLGVNESVTRTIGSHVLQLSRGPDLPDAKNLIVTVKS